VVIGRDGSASIRCVQVADELAAHGDPISANAIRQAIADRIHEQRLEADIARASARLVAAG
jgi:hypothetical protein